MPNYTNNEFMRMRDQAIVHARDMQRRAAIKQDETFDSQPERRESKSSISFEKYSEPAYHNTDSRQTNNISKKPQHVPKPQDNERMLIMTLLLILIADGADKMLIFALMYIMM